MYVYWPRTSAKLQAKNTWRGDEAHAHRTLDSVEPVPDSGEAGPDRGVGSSRDVVERGFELEYEAAVSSYVYEDDFVIQEEECMEVLDIMDMFSVLKRAHGSLPDNSEIEECQVKFVGFHGNKETQQLAYVRFKVYEQGQFTDLDRRDNFNSHVPMLPAYRRMLEEWEILDKKYDLTKGELVRITEARKHPDQQ